MPTRSSLARAALAGLCIGFAVGGLFLLATALKVVFRPFDCAELTPKECTLARKTEREMSRWQALAGGALGLLALGGYSLLRRPDEPL